jgi:glutathione S-transferase
MRKLHKNSKDTAKIWRETRHSITQYYSIHRSKNVKTFLESQQIFFFEMQCVIVDIGCCNNLKQSHQNQFAFISDRRSNMMPMRILLVALLLGSTTVIGFAPLSPSEAVRRDGTTRLQMSVPTQIDTLTSGLASICRLPGGTTVIQSASKLLEEEKPKLKQLFDVENSRTCRKVRERITELDLVVGTVIPAASNSRVFTDSAYVYALPQGTVIPRLVLAEASGEERVLSGDEAILAYLDETFSVPAVDTDDPKEKVVNLLREAGSYVAELLRVGRGSSVSSVAGASAPRPAKSLVLYSYEGNQFCRLVREVLTELDIPYELRSAGKESLRRKELAEVSGKSQQPYLMDPNTGDAMPESLDIIRYLYKTYALWTPPNEILQWASAVVLPPVKPLFATLAPLQAGSTRDDKTEYEKEISQAKTEIEAAIKASPVVVYTYDLSPFSFETKALLDNLEISYKEISLGKEWIPGLIGEGGSQTRAALLDITGQSSLPQVFIGGKSIGGLFSGTPGLVPALEQGSLREMVSNASMEMAAPVQS